MGVRPVDDQGGAALSRGRHAPVADRRAPAPVAAHGVATPLAGSSRRNRAHECRPTRGHPQRARGRAAGSLRSPGCCCRRRCPRRQGSERRPRRTCVGVSAGHPVGRPDPRHLLLVGDPPRRSIGPGTCRLRCAACGCDRPGRATAGGSRGSARAGRGSKAAHSPSRCHGRTPRSATGPGGSRLPGSARCADR